MQNSRIYTNLFAFLHIYLQSSFFDNCRLLGMTELKDTSVVLQTYVMSSCTY